MKYLLYLLGFCIVMQYAQSFASEQGTGGYRVYIQPVAIVNKDYITLADIARILPPFDTKIGNIQSIPLWEAPQAIGSSITITASALRKKMQELLGKEAIFCHYPSAISIQRGGKIFYKEQIQKEIQSVLTRYVQQQYNAELQIQEIRLPEYLLAKDEDAVLKIGIKGDMLPKIALSVHLSSPQSKREERFIASASIQLKAKTWCASKSISRGESLSENTERCTILTIDPSYIAQERTLNGYRAKKIVNKGEGLFQQDIEKMPDIVRGSTVQLVYNKNGIVLSTQVQALADARIGERIKVLPQYSKKSLDAIVLDNRTVKIL